MVYRTLHTYILRQLLRIFLLTASALTTLMAFGGTFRPLTRQNIEVGQLMAIMLNLMPAMLAYAIPIAALFASVLVYWRMSTDNEMTACRAGGISFITIVAPAFLLGLVVASVDLAFVNYVVPHYLHSFERGVMGEIGSIMVGQINHQEKFEYPGWGVVYADGAEMERLPGSDSEGETTVITLHGVAASLRQRGKDTEVIARQATVRITSLPDQDASRIEGSVQDGSAFDPTRAFQRLTASVDTLSPDGRPWIVPSLLKSKPKFYNLQRLLELDRDPTAFPPVEDAIQRIRESYANQQVSRNIYEQWRAAAKDGKPLVFDQSALGSTQMNQIQIFAKEARIDESAPSDDCLTLTGRADAPVRVEQYARGKLQSTQTCDTIDVQVINDQYTGSGMGASLELHGNVRRHDLIRDIHSAPASTLSLSGILLTAEERTVPPLDADPSRESRMLVDFADASPQKALRDQGTEAANRIQKLYQTIDSELHSRGSFSLSCLTLVLFGAALGILLRGKNPLAVFVLGFVPAVFLVLLITAGRELAEGNIRTAHAGLVMIWAGNGILFVLVAGVYAKLLRQ